jgi:hypothetical protein
MRNVVPHFRLGRRSVRQRGESSVLLRLARIPGDPGRVAPGGESSAGLLWWEDTDGLLRAGAGFCGDVPAPQRSAIERGERYTPTRPRCALDGALQDLVTAEVQRVALGGVISNAIVRARSGGTTPDSNLRQPRAGWRCPPVVYSLAALLPEEKSARALLPVPRKTRDGTRRATSSPSVSDTPSEMRAMSDYLDDAFPLGDGVADLSTWVQCPYCGEEVELLVDPGGGSVQEYVEDCEVCCRPMLLTVSWDDDGGAHARAASDDDVA